MFHRLAGIAISILFALIYTGNLDWFSNFNESVARSLDSDLDVDYRSSNGGVNSGGVIYLYMPEQCGIKSVFECEAKFSGNYCACI